MLWNADRSSFNPDTKFKLSRIWIQDYTLKFSIKITTKVKVNFETKFPSVVLLFSYVSATKSFKKKFEIKCRHFSFSFLWIRISNLSRSFEFGFIADPDPQHWCNKINLRVRGLSFAKLFLAFYLYLRWSVLPEYLALELEDDRPGDGDRP
jgi:hypothetical protein